jgi:benzodiazapine receptor
MKYDKTYYNSLVRSPLTPPSYVFSIVWPILYLTLAIAFFYIYTNKKCVGFCTPLVYFSIQLVFNLIWTTLFFKLKMPTIALLDLILIVSFTLITLSTLFNDYKNAFYVMLPYTCWILFALYLNTYIVFNN